MKTDAELKVLINDHFKAIDNGRQDGLNNDTLEAVLSFWKNNLGSELVFHKTNSGTDQSPRIAIGFNVNKSGTQFTADAPGKYWINFQWVSGGGYYHSVVEVSYVMTFDCPAAYDNIGTYFDNVYTTIAKALAAERNLFGRMADAIRDVNGSSSTINGQDIPNEIRALKEISPVVKTYDNLTDYLTDIGTLLKQSGSSTINAQDFPQAILNLDDAYLMYTNLLQWDKITSTLLSLQEFKVLYNRANTAYGKNQWNLYATYAIRYGYDSAGISIGAVPIDVDMVYGENGYNQGTFNGHGNDWYPLGQGSGTYECVSMYKWRWNTSTWSVWLNKDDTYIGSDNYFQGYGFGWDKYAIYNDTKIVAPNGYRYNYKTTISSSFGNGIYNYYTDYPLFVCEDKKISSSSETNGNYYLLSLLKTIDNLNTIVQVDTSLGSYTSTSTRVYPSSGSFGGYNKFPAISYGQNEATCPYNWATNLTPQEVSDQNITVYSTMEEAYKALTDKYYAPNGNLYENKYTYYASWTHTSGTSGADMWMDYRIGASPVHNNTVVYWDVKNHNYSIPDMNNGTNKYTSNTYKNDYYVKTGTLDNQSMAMGLTPGVYPCKTFSSDIPVFSTIGELLAYITEKYVLTTVDSANYTGYELDVVSDYPFFFITSTPSSRGEVYTAAKGSDGNIYLCRIYLTSNTRYWQVDCKYPSLPSGVTFSTNYYATVSDGTMTVSTRILGGTPTNYPNLRVFADYQGAYDYITSL